MYKYGNQETAPLNKTCFCESQKCSAFLHRFQSFCGNGDGHFFAEFGDEKGLGLQIDLPAALARRVEFGRTRSVGIAPADLGFLASDVTRFCHSPSTLSCR